MPRLLRTIRFDASDSHVFAQAAGPDEWAVSGAFAFAALNQPPVGKLRQAFANGFFSLESFGRATFVTVADCPEVDLRHLTQKLAQHFVESYGAPDLAAATPAADEEIGFACDLCREAPINQLFTVSRRFDEEGQLRETFRVVEPPGERPHAKVWEIIGDA